VLSANNTGRGHLNRQEMLKSFDTFEVSSSNADMKPLASTIPGRGPWQAIVPGWLRRESTCRFSPLRLSLSGLVPTAARALNSGIRCQSAANWSPTPSLRLRSPQIRHRLERTGFQRSWGLSRYFTFVDLECYPMMWRRKYASKRLRDRSGSTNATRNIVVKCDSRQPRHAFGQKRVETLCINIVDPKRIHGAPRNAIPIHHRFPQRKFALRLDYNVDLSSQE